jgi:hypothetical protein
MGLRAVKRTNGSAPRVSGGIVNLQLRPPDTLLRKVPDDLIESRSVQNLSLHDPLNAIAKTRAPRIRSATRGAAPRSIRCLAPITVKDLWPPLAAAAPGLSRATSAVRVRRQRWRRLRLSRHRRRPSSTAQWRSRAALRLDEPAGDDEILPRSQDRRARWRLREPDPVTLLGARPEIFISSERKIVCDAIYNRKGFWFDPPYP